MSDLSVESHGMQQRAFLMDRLLPRGEVSMLYGDGASGKSLLVQAIAASVQMGRSLPGKLACRAAVPVIYYDWETNQRVIQHRLKRLCLGWGMPVPPVRYVAMQRPLGENIARVRKDIDSIQAGLVIIDSIGFAAASGDLTQADAATRMFNDLRSLNTTVLTVHHLTKESAERHDGAVKPYGSSYFYNATRNAWEIRSVPENENLLSSLWHRKDNDGYLWKRPLGLRFAFEADEGPIYIESTDVDDTPELAAHGGLTYQIRQVLAEGSMTARQLAEVLGANFKTVSRALRRMPDVINLDEHKGGSGNVARYGLLARQE